MHKNRKIILLSIFCIFFWLNTVNANVDRTMVNEIVDNWCSLMIHYRVAGHANHYRSYDMLLPWQILVWDSYILDKKDIDYAMFPEQVDPTYVNKLNNHNTIRAEHNVHVKWCADKLSEYINANRAKYEHFWSHCYNSNELECKFTIHDTNQYIITPSWVWEGFLTRTYISDSPILMNKDPNYNTDYDFWINFWQRVVQTKYIWRLTTTTKILLQPDPINCIYYVDIDEILCKSGKSNIPEPPWTVDLQNMTVNGSFPSIQGCETKWSSCASNWSESYQIYSNNTLTLWGIKIDWKMIYSEGTKNEYWYIDPFSRQLLVDWRIPDVAIV